MQPGTKARFPILIPIFIVVVLTAVMACTAEITLPRAAGVVPTTTTPQTREISTEPIPTLNPAAMATNCPNGDCANVCLSRLTAIPLTGGSQEKKPKATGEAPNGTPAVVLVTYPVSGDTLGAPSYAEQVPAALSSLQKDKIAQAKIWEYFSALIPADQRTTLAYFIMATDGKGGMLASVEQFSGHTGLWALVVDPADASRPRDLTFTLMHEFGHLLSLDSSQVKPDEAVLSHPADLQILEKQTASCPQYFASGGCSLPDSYINQFFDRFWAKLYGEWTTVDAARKKSNYLALLARFYQRHPTQFITAYAASSPEEDVAESWAYFVLNLKPQDDSVAHKKVLFFYKFPELVSLRNQIATNICTYAATQ
jgi:hypothetical protein